MEITKKEFKNIIQGERKEYQRFLGVIIEDFDSKLNVVIEIQQEQGKKNDLLFAMVAKNTEDIAIIKQDISFIKQELKHKVDRDEFEALEKRVILLENKFKRA